MIPQLSLIILYNIFFLLEGFFFIFIYLNLLIKSGQCKRGPGEIFQDFKLIISGSPSTKDL